MAQISITDTGFATPDDNGTQVSTSARANAGSEITLKGVTVGVASVGNYDNSPTLNNFQVSPVNFGSIENDVITITGIVNTSISADRTIVYQLKRLPHTVGYKVVYYNSTSDNTASQLVTMAAGSNVFSSAQQSSYGVGGAYYYLNVKFTSFDISQQAGSDVIQYKLSGLVLPYKA